MVKVLEYNNSDNKPEFIMVVGLPGSGKSTFVKRYKGYKVHSSDDIREELSGDINNQDINSLVFKTLHNRVKEDLLNGQNVIYDATNVNRKRRKAFLQELNNIPCWKQCVLIATPFEVCLERNNQRDRKVPYNVIERMYKNFDIPWYNEGWDNICVEYTDSKHKEAYNHWSKFIFDTLDFDQESKWHKETLGEHCRLCAEYVAKQIDELGCLNEKEILVAAALHDCGKPFCKEFKDSKGDPSEFAHYYGHENVGSYDSLFYKMDEGIDRLLVAALIRYHMVLHFFKDWKPKTVEKYEKEFTSHKLDEMDFYKALKILHEGDKNAH